MIECGVLDHFPNPSAVVHFKDISELRKKVGNRWYNSLKVLVCDNPYNAAVDTHFRFQALLEPKSMTLTTSFKDPRWREMFKHDIAHMKIDSYHDYLCLESFSEDVNRIQSLFNFERTKAERKLSKHRPHGTEDYKTLYDGRTRAAVTRVAKQIIQEYGYQF